MLVLRRNRTLSKKMGPFIAILCRIRSSIGLIFTAIILLSSATQSVGQPNFDGAWSGTIGNKRVMACIVSSGGSTYYYVNESSEIPLEFAKSDRLIERIHNRTTGNWLLNSPMGNRLTGSWSDATGKRSIPIVLNRIEELNVGTFDNGMPDQDTCVRSERYYDPWINAQKVKSGRLKRSHGVTYHANSEVSDAVSTIELVGDPKVMSINRTLHQRWRQQMARYFACERDRLQAGANNIKQRGEGHVYRVSIVSSSRFLLTIKESYTSRCFDSRHSSAGTTWDGAEIGDSYITWYWSIGKQVNFQSWFNEYAYRELERSSFEATDSFTGVLGKVWYATHPCKDEILECLPGRCYPVRATEEGIVFNASPGGYPLPVCTEDVVVPFDLLVPFLSPEGKAQARRSEK